MIFKKEIHILGSRQEDVILKHPNWLMRKLGIKYEYNICWHERIGTTDHLIIRIK